MARYFVGDTPVEAWPVPSYDLDLAPFTGVEVRLMSPAGVLTEGPTATIAPEESTVYVSWPATPVLNSRGLWRLEVIVTQGVRRETLPLVFIAVDGDTGWHTLDSIRAEWPDAPINDDAYLFTLLEAARDQCEAFAPVLTGPVPTRYKVAHLLQVRSLWQSGSVNQDGALGGGDMTVTVFPMDWTVKALLRPKRAVGGIF